MLAQAKQNRLFQSGFVYHYSLILVLGIFIIFLLSVFGLSLPKVFSLLCLSAIISIYN